MKKRLMLWFIVAATVSGEVHAITCAEIIGVLGQCANHCDLVAGDLSAPADTDAPAAAVCGYPKTHALNFMRECSAKWTTEVYAAPQCVLEEDVSLTAQAVYESYATGSDVEPRLCGPGRLLAPKVIWTETCRRPGIVNPGNGLVNYYSVHKTYGLTDSGLCCVGGPACGCS